MKKIFLVISLFLLYNMSLAQLGATVSEIKAMYHTEPLEFGETAEGYYYLGYAESADFDYYFYFSNEVCFLKKVIPIHQENIDDIFEELDTNQHEKSYTKWVKGKRNYDILIEKVHLEDTATYYYEYTVEY